MGRARKERKRQRALQEFMDADALHASTQVEGRDSRMSIYRRGSNDDDNKLVVAGGVNPPPPKIDPAILKAIREANIGVGWADSVLDKPLSYLVGHDGLYMRKVSTIGEVTIRIGPSLSARDEIGAAPKVVEGYKMPFPQIPFEVFSNAITFLREVKKVHDTEGLVRFYYHADTQTWTAYVPEQIVSGASVDVADTEPDQPGLFAAEIHSHPGASSSFSGTDDKHEQLDRLFFCVAFPANSSPDFHTRVGTGMERWLNLTLPSVVDMAEPITMRVSPRALLNQKQDFFPYMESPEQSEWMKKVTKERPTVVVTGANGHYHYNGPAGSVHNLNPHGFRGPGGNVVGQTVNFPKRADDGVVRDWRDRMKDKVQQEAEDARKVEEWLKERGDAGDAIGDINDHTGGFSD